MGPKEFGRRGVAAPPVVTNAPQGLPGVLALSPARKRSLAIALVALGAGSLGGFAAYEAAAPSDCPREGDPPQGECAHKSGGGHGGSSSRSGWFFGGSGGHDSSGSSHTGGSSSIRSFFGGFGHMGFGHGGGS
ncbi:MULTISPECIES: hypothetical protein [Methylosinus]|uniref:Uncharacterized protein n=1 Tax=Methylosinus trichosporium (strain ATCC 35070 / NCIMB 11131 / UNIQEM 75 / OB3b) TaxID=595536 RepID=A0A2D2CY06_METT3|nr:MULTISPECIES: hypothetical protein [Methylosinus]ATQ67596.1 hypothetical protein CQW49_06615 [Methylosinus trichosporium OB3b]OBS52138.1 hypothetical protein A8B73_12555 [Methylosinus sp. 3S-1]